MEESITTYVGLFLIYCHLERGGGAEKHHDISQLKSDICTEANVGSILRMQQHYSLGHKLTGTYAEK